MEDYDQNKEYELHDKITPKKLTPLQYAIWKKLPINKILAQAPKNELHAIVNQTNDAGMTPLMVAAMFGRDKGIATVQLLIDLGAEVNEQTNNGSTALIFAASFTRITSSEKVVELLLKAGADPNLQNKSGITVLMYAATDSGKNSTEKTVEILLQPQYGIDVNILNNDGCTALMYAARYSKTTSTEKTVLLLLEAVEHVKKSPSVSTVGPVLRNPSVLNSAKKLKYKTNINIRDEDGMTALMYACKGVLEKTSTKNTVKLLINYGATYTGKDLENCTTGRKYSVRANSAATSLQQHYRKHYYDPDRYKNTAQYKSMQERYNQI